jgi:hypothetical protein
MSSILSFFIFLSPALFNISPPYQGGLSFPVFSSVWYFTTLFLKIQHNIVLMRDGAKKLPEGLSGPSGRRVFISREKRCRAGRD